MHVHDPLHKVENISYLPKHTTSADKVPTLNLPKKNDLCKELMLSHYSDSVVVITSAVHAEGRGFNPRSEYVLSTFLGRRDRTIKTTCSGGVELVLARLATAFFRQPFRDTLQQTQSFVLSKYQSQKKLSRSERYQV